MESRGGQLCRQEWLTTRTQLDDRVLGDSAVNSKTTKTKRHMIEFTYLSSNFHTADVCLCGSAQSV